MKTDSQGIMTPDVHGWFMLKCFNFIFTRWPETLVDSKTNKPSQKKGAKVCDISTHSCEILILCLKNTGQIDYEGGNTTVNNTGSFLWFV